MNVLYPCRCCTLQIIAERRKILKIQYELYLYTVTPLVHSTTMKQVTSMKHETHYFLIAIIQCYFSRERTFGFLVNSYIMISTVSIFIRRICDIIDMWFYLFILYSIQKTITILCYHFPSNFNVLYPSIILFIVLIVI